MPRAAKTYLRWSSLSGGMWLRRSQFSKVWQNMEKEWYASWESQLYTGRLTDTILAVSALAMASAVAWVDWVMSCCGVGVNSAMSQVLGGQVLIMVRIGKILRRGYDTKMAVSREPSVQFTSFLDTVYLRICPTTRLCCFHGNDVTGCVWVCKMYQGLFSGRKTRKDTTWSDS